MLHEEPPNSNRTWSFRFDHLIAGAIFLLVSFRLIALPFILLCAIQPSKDRRSYNIVVLFALALAFASPIDVGVPGVARVFGDHRSGVRVLHVDVGMPAHHVLKAKYGEYVSVGCAGLPCAYQPRWWVVWW